VFTTVLGQIQALSTESALRNTAGALFPAAQSSQEAEAAYQRMVKGFSDAVMTQDASALDRAAEDGRQVVEGLKRVAAIPGLPGQRAAEVGQLASTVERYAADARTTYAAALANPAALTAAMQDQMRALAGRSDTVKTSLTQTREGFSKALRDELAVVRDRSAFQRGLALALFGISVALAAVIVNLTIRRSITGPILRVIHGVEQVAGEAGQASERVAHSGQVVSTNAQEQASYIEETSASLEEISATTRQNASRAGDADRLMNSARETVDRAAAAMNDLETSMDVISKSSKQVSDVLKSIDEIAFHTNILALNAAVEAARAGEAGAGFSVVADEVRSLAQRAAEAARRSAEIIEKTVHDVSTGVQLVAQAHSAFQEVSSSIASGSRMVSEIAASSDEQARGITHIGTAISRIESVTQNNVANAQETAEAGATLRTQMQATRHHLEELIAVVGLRGGAAGAGKAAAARR
jgi:ABC-type transporter Mla subunit MlaD